MAGEVKITIAEVKRFNKLAGVYAEIAKFKAVACAEKAVRVVTDFIAQEIKKYLQKDVKKPGDQVFSGDILDSAVGKVIRGGASVTGEIIFPQEYAKYLERGRAPGEGLETAAKRKAERERLVKWALEKKPGEDPRQVAGRVLGKMLRKGTNKSNSAIGFVQPVLDKFGPKIPQMIQREFLDCLDKELLEVKGNVL